MSYFSNIFISAVFLFFSSVAIGQENLATISNENSGATLVLIDRPPIKLDKVSWDSSSVYYVKEGRRRQKAMDLTKVYSIISGNGDETVVYVQDTLENNWYTAEQMKDYMLGQQDAANAYKPRANKTAAGGVMFGFIGSATGLFYGPLFVIGYTFWKGSSTPDFKEEYGYNLEYIDNPFYKEGFGTMAKRYTTRRSSVASAAGYILGAVTLTLVVR